MSLVVGEMVEYSFSLQQKKACLRFNTLFLHLCLSLKFIEMFVY